MAAGHSWRGPHLGATTQGGIRHGPERRVDAPVTLERLGVNAPRVAEALRTAAQPLSIGEIETATNLTRAQVRYALKSLVKARFVRMDGTRGSQATTYEWLANRGAADA
ncbi:helix-turn-helix domain-containing protein [Corynebacterium guaraldiae]|uniref:helix-turn-helix domain-containing protein n=1 Tax=Corynebacterium guaraldiae TaxID=3051103 RepID=UPI0032AF238B